MQLIDLTVTNRGPALDLLPGGPTVYGFDVDDIIVPVRFNSTLSKSYFTTITGGSKINYQVSETLSQIKAKSIKLLILTVVQRRGVATTGTYVFVASRISEDIIPNTLGTKFYYMEDGDPLPVEYIVSESVATIIAQQVIPAAAAAARNGLNINGGYVELGGTLVRNTSIDVVTFTYELKRGASSIFKIGASGELLSASVLSDTTFTGAKAIVGIDSTGKIYNTNVDPTALWKADGNLFGAVKYIGTNDTFDFPVYTNGLERMRVLSGGDVAIGATTASARLYIKGVDSTSSNYGLRIDSSASSPILCVRNDGYVGIGTTAPVSLLSIVAPNNGPYAFSVRNNTFSANVLNGFRFYQENDGRIFTDLNNFPIFTYAPTGQVRLDSSDRTTSTDTKLLTRALVAGSSNYAFYARGFAINSGLTVDGDGNTGFNQLVASAKVHIRADSTTSADYGLKIVNSTLGSLLSVRADGLISMPSAPVGSAGLVTGDTYFDTSANIIANGDLFLARKV